MKTTEFIKSLGDNFQELQTPFYEVQDLDDSIELAESEFQTIMIKNEDGTENPYHRTKEPINHAGQSGVVRVYGPLAPKMKLVGVVAQRDYGNTKAGQGGLRFIAA